MVDRFDTDPSKNGTQRRQLGRLVGTIRVHADLVAPAMDHDVERDMVVEWLELNDD